MNIIDIENKITKISLKKIMKKNVVKIRGLYKYLFLPLYVNL
jgi:hypothetical protein